MEPLQYLDFELKIEREGDHYTARVLRSPAGEASCDFTLPFSGDRLELLVMKLGRPRGSTRRIHSAEMEAACELGGKLFEAVFGGDVRACLRSSLDEVYRKERTGLRLKLRLQEVPLLSDLPWEFLLDATLDRFFAQSNQTPIVRYIEMPERIKPLTVNLPLHLLVMISSPSDYLRLDVERERSRLEETLEPLSKAGKVRVKWLENPTLTDLLRCLREGEYHVFHFIGHGGFDKRREEGVLVLEDEQGRGWLADVHRIGTILHDHPSLRLAVLNSCEGARNSMTDPFAGMATGLIRQGVPAVVAMQFEITDEAAITFAGEFYAAIAQGFPVDAAVAEARKAIYIQPNDIEWGTPVLYMRSSDGVLFDLTQKPAAEETMPTAHKPVLESLEPEPPPELHPSFMSVLVVEPQIINAGDEAKLTFRLHNNGDDNLHRVTVRRGRTRLDEPFDMTIGQERHFTFTTTYKTEGKKTVKVTVTGVASNGESVRSEAIAIVQVRPPPTSKPAPKPKPPVKLKSTVRTLVGHTETVNSVAFSPDGKTLASGAGSGLLWSNDNTVRLWRVSDGKLLRTMEGHTNWVRSVAVSPDGKTLASGSDDNTVRLWRVLGRKLLRTLEGHTNTVMGVAFSPDGKTLASGSDDSTVRLWRVSDGKLLRTLEGHTNTVMGVAFSPDGKTLASGSADNTVRLWGWSRQR